MDCHGIQPPKGGLFLGESSSGGYFEAFENLLTVKNDSESDPYMGIQNMGIQIVHPGYARKSRLIHMLFGWEERSSAGKTAHNDLLSERERRIVAEWIDLGAHWDNQYFTTE
jgi:hypothetical protein